MKMKITTTSPGFTKLTLKRVRKMPLGASPPHERAEEEYIQATTNNITTRDYATWGNATTRRQTGGEVGSPLALRPVGMAHRH